MHRRHHNNEGRRQIRRGHTREQVNRMAGRLGVPAVGTRLIIVNGRPVGYREPVLTYEAIVALAGLQGTPSCVWRYRGQPAGQREGILHPGQGVHVRAGMVIDCMHTGAA